MAKLAKLDDIVSLCKRRGFIYQSSEIYGGLASCYDYGPLGAELKRNLKDYWWRKTVQERDDVLGLDGAILTMEQVLVASGHVGGFSDPMCDCLLSKARLRADQIPAQSGTVYHFTGASHAESDWSITRDYSVLAKEGEDENKARKTARQYFAQFLSDKQISPKALELAGRQPRVTTFEVAVGCMAFDRRQPHPEPRRATGQPPGAAGRQQAQQPEQELDCVDHRRPGAPP